MLCVKIEVIFCKRFPPFFFQENPFYASVICHRGAVIDDRSSFTKVTMKSMAFCSSTEIRKNSQTKTLSSPPGFKSLILLFSNSNFVISLSSEQKKADKKAGNGKMLSHSNIHFFTFCVYC